jgi:hypothetical protein
MSTQWDDGTPPVFAPGKPVQFLASKQRGNSTPVQMVFTVHFEWDYDTLPNLTDSELIGWFQPIYDGLKDAGWSVQVTQETTSHRSIEEV